MRTDDLDRRVIDALNRLADEVEPSERLRDRALAARAERRAFRGPRLLVAAAVVVATSLAAGLLVRASNDDDAAEVTTADDVTAGDDGWVAMPEAPIPTRRAAASVWTGTELLIWGGSDPSFNEHFNDGAAYDPTSRRWRHMADGPDSAGGKESHGVWTGEEALFFWIGDSIDGPEGLAAYDPAADTWRELAPWPLGPREGVHVVWTGDALVAVGGGSGDAIPDALGASYDPGTDEWTVLPDPPYEHWIPDSVSAVDGKVVVVGGLESEGGSSIDPQRPVPGAVYDPAAGTWTAISEGSAGHWGAANDEGLVVDLGADRVGVYDVAADAWSTHDVPADRDPTQIAGVMSAGDDVIAYTYAFKFDVINPHTGTWRSLEDAPFDELQSPIVVAFTGRDLIVWGDEGAQLRVPCDVIVCTSDGDKPNAPAVALVSEFLDAVRAGDLDAAAQFVSSYVDGDDTRATTERFLDDHDWLIDATDVELIETPSFSWTADTTNPVVTAAAGTGPDERRTVTFVIGVYEDDRPRIVRISSDAEFRPTRGAVVGPGDRVVLTAHPVEGGATAHVNGRRIPDPAYDDEAKTMTIVLPAWVGAEDEIVLTYSEGTPELPYAASNWYRTTDEPHNWVAVFAVEPYTEDDRQRVIGSTGLMFEGPASCFDWLVEDLELPGPLQILAVVAETEEDMQDGVDAVGLSPIHTGRYRNRCVG